ncbi:hypothetical protein DVH24_037034 [Malus domestica]|uniref:Uncharacterized protein n=1 Tax=Malus domestica TaxID=3750 RepID=A0A498HEP0_MALDO|nr:hypothetical protein DVH24_037034 [Malus domestica]
MVSLIVAVITYVGSLIGSRILHIQARPNSNLAESMINKISLLFGTLAFILEVVILVPGLGIVTLLFWVVWFVNVVVEYACEYLEPLYQCVVASVVHTFGKLKEHLNMIIRRFAMESEERTDELPQVTSTTHMTLNLEETKEEQPCFVPPNSDNLIEEVTLSKRPRRGQSRRGRQLKDFQRNVLPGLASLESGGSWQSSLSQRNSSKGGRGRWRKRMGTPTPSTNVDEVSQPQIEQPKCEELQGPEERNVTCWGKRTRRPPRQRYPIDNSPVHKYICSLIAMLGDFLQLKQGVRNESLFSTDYPVMVFLIVTLIAYIGSLIGSIILRVQAHPNLDLAESIINKISLLLGTLALVLEVVILVPGLGLVAGFFWVVWFVKIVIEYACEYLKTLYKNPVASIVHSFWRLSEDDYPMFRNETQRTN